MRLAIVITHPIQYYVPIFQLLTVNSRIRIKVFYTWSQWEKESFDRDFGLLVRWDIPLVEGYNHEFVTNSSSKPGIYSFFGINNPSLIHSVNCFAPDAVLIFGWNYLSHIKLIWKLSGKIPIYFRGDSTLLDESKGVKTLIRRLWLRLIYRFIDKVFHVGQLNEDYFRAHGIHQNQLILAPHAVDNQRFAKSIETNLRSDLGLSPEDIVILFVGKLEPKKNPLLLLESVMDVNREDIKLVIVGSGVLENEVTSKLSEKVLLMPFQNQSKMPAIYGLGDVLCLPSQGPGETWGLVVNEAFACKLPAIVSDKVGCHKDLIVDSETGFTFESGNKKQLTEVIKHLNKSKLSRMGNNAHKLIMEQYNYRRLVKVIEDELLG